MGLDGLRNKVVLVAGGATGIGAATARRLGSEGSQVVVADISTIGAEETAARINADGGTAVAVAFDLADETSVDALFQTVRATFGPVQLLVNVGADMGVLLGDTDVVDIDLAIWDRTLTVNLRGYLLTMKHAIPDMLQKGGSIVNMSSAAAFLGEPTRPAYATAKAGIGALTRHVASRWGREGVRCNAVAPGFTATEAIRSVPQWPELEASALRGTRSPRVGEVTDVAALVAFLLSDEAEWINGQVVNVDGGSILR